MESASTRPRIPFVVESLLFAFVCGFAVVFASLHQTMNLVHPPAALERLCDYSAETPYQNRILVPTIVRAIDASGLGAKLGLTQMDSARWIEIACIVALFYALRSLIARFTAPKWPPSAWAIAGLYALPFLYLFPRAWPYWYPWDIPAVLFTTLGILWIQTGRWPWYYWCFPFATLNRETTFLLVLIFVVTQFGVMKWWPYLQHIAAQVAIWLCIKFLLGLTFRRSPGVGEYYADAFKDNWAALHTLSTYGTMSLCFGFLWLPLLCVARDIRETFVRRALIVVPVFFAVSFRLAQFDELRIYGELLPLVVLALACGVAGWRAKRATALSAP